MGFLCCEFEGFIFRWISFPNITVCTITLKDTANLHGIDLMLALKSSIECAHISETSQLQIDVL